MSENEQENAVALKLPTFWSSQARVWFVQAEASFHTKNITADATKYNYVVAALDQNTATRVLDYIEAPPANDKYNGLKTRLLDTFTLSEYERANRLIDSPDLGDDKPSALMDKMLALIGNHPPCFLFRVLFLKRLPEDIRGPLLHSKEEDCRTLAKAADTLWSAKAHSTNAVSKAKPVTQRKAETSGKSKFYTWRQTWTQSTGGPCAYHSFFGTAARKCTTPCSSDTSMSGHGSVGRQ